MKIKMYFARCTLVLVILLSGCVSGKANQDEMSNDIKDYAFLKERPGYDQVVVKLGVPDDEIGSGIFIFVYHLKNDAQLVISYVSLDSLSFASIQFSDGSWKKIVSANENEDEMSNDIKEYAFLKERPSYYQVVAVLGEPDFEGEFGLHLIRYQLINNAELHIRFVFSNTVSSAEIRFSDGSRKIIFPLPEKEGELSDDINDYVFLKERPGYDKVLSVLGAPYSEGGSGVYRIVYQLKNDAILTIWNINRDTFDSAEIEFSDGSRQIIVPPP